MSNPQKPHNPLGEMFPTQFKTIPSIIIWTLVYILDVAVVFWVAYLLDFPLLSAATRNLMVIIYMVIAFALFCLESFLYNLIKH